MLVLLELMPGLVAYIQIETNGKVTDTLFPASEINSQSSTSEFIDLRLEIKTHEDR
jgi:hypothetical protein